MGFLDFLKNHLDDIGTGVGFMAGGPVGAGIGRAVGGAVEDRKLSPGQMLTDAALGYGGGLAGNALGLGAGEAAPLVSESFTPAAVGGSLPAQASAAAPTATSAAVTPASVGGSIPAAAIPSATGGGFLSKMGDWWKALEPESQAGLVGQGIGAGADIYGTVQQGKMLDEDRERQERIRQYLSPRIAEMMEQNF